jgi:hypothetical protein
MGACQTGATPRPADPARDIVDPDPALRSRTLALAAGRGSRERLAEWIECLDDPDATVRLQAVASLKEATGEASAYRPFDSVEVRRTHLEAWRAWWRREIAHPDPALLAPDAPADLEAPDAPEAPQAPEAPTAVTAADGSTTPQDAGEDAR